jgi:serine/threonine protein kinase
MTPTTQTPPTGSATPAAGAERLAAEIKQRWRDGEPPDAAAALAEYSELLAFKSVVVELAYEEYCLREQGDAAPQVGPFCARMPAFRGSIRKVIEAHRLLIDHPEVLAPEPNWPEPGDRFDGLEVLAELGRGTFARAYLSYDPQTDRACVLKLSPGRGGEGRALGRLQHPHITDLYWADRLRGMTAVCMPLLGVTTLDDVREAVFPDAQTLPHTAATLLGAIQPTPGAAAAPPPIASSDESHTAGVIAIAARIADALAYLHRHNREHGDLKPSNVVLAPGGHPYLIDFNLAGDETVGVGGTIPYMAPERLSTLVGGPPASADRAKADVYSYGVVLYEMLTGRLPWAPDPRLGQIGAAADLLARRRVGVAWPEAASVPAPVAGLVEACLADTPEYRPTAAAVAAALSSWLSAARGESPGRAAWKRWASRLVCAAGVAAVLLGFAAMLSSGNPSPNGSADAAEPRATNPQLSPGVSTPVAQSKDPFQGGLEELRRGNPSRALAQFHLAGKNEPDRGRAMAYQAYCLAKIATQSEDLNERKLNLDTAFNQGVQATKSGADWGVVNNNIGYVCLERNWPKEAVGYLNRAVELSPDLLAARYNRAYARYKAMVDNPPARKGFPPEFSDLTAAEDILRVLATPPRSAEFYNYSARILAASSHLNPDLRNEAVRCATEAVRLGIAPRALVRDPILAPHLADKPGFRDAPSRSQPPAKPRGEEFRLVEPIQP